VTLTASERTAIVRPPSWHITLPAGTPLLNANQRLHHHPKAQLTKTIRDAACLLARQARIPNLQHAHICYVVHPGGVVRRRDPGNWAPTAKAAVDGLVDAGVLPDDDSTRLLGPDPRIGAPVKGSQFALWITDLDEMSPHHIALLNPPGAPE
jgi:crossover junction endodeoxyribonuclease RusA